MVSVALLFEEQICSESSLYQIYLGKVLPAMFVAFQIVLFSVQYLDLNFLERTWASAGCQGMS